VFSTALHFHPSQLFCGQGLEPTIRVESHKGFHSDRLKPCSPILKVEVNGYGKRSSLLRYGNNYGHKKLYSLGPRGNLIIKLFTAKINSVPL
jgi:hypothetical protein